MIFISENLTSCLWFILLYMRIRTLFQLLTIPWLIPVVIFHSAINSRHLFIKKQHYHILSRHIIPVTVGDLLPDTSWGPHKLRPSLFRWHNKRTSWYKSKPDSRLLFIRHQWKARPLPGSRPWQRISLSSNQRWKLQLRWWKKVATAF